MSENTYISFYLKYSTIHIFRSTIRSLDTPKFVQFRVHHDCKSMILLPCTKKTFTTFRVPENIYSENGGMRIISKRLCNILADRLEWDTEASYRVQGKIIRREKIVLFDLSGAVRYYDHRKNDILY